jgi:2-keto-3-deoxy-L-rhamnonate aldolase RhmA
VVEVTAGGSGASVARRRRHVPSVAHDVSVGRRSGSRRSAAVALTACVLWAGCAPGDAAPEGQGAGAAGEDAAGLRLLELWAGGEPAFGIFVPDEREGGARSADGTRLPPLYTREGGRRLAANPLYDYVFLNLEGAYDEDAVRALAAGLREEDAGARPALLVRIPPISQDGEAAARARVAGALANGADGVVLPHVRSPEEARVAVGFFEQAGADVWSPDNRGGSVVAMLMVEDPGALATAREIADVPGYSVLACGIGSLTRALGGDREAAEAAEAGTLGVLAHATRVGRPDMITANAEDAARRIEEGFLALLMSGSGADDAIRVGRAAAGR